MADQPITSILLIASTARRMAAASGMYVGFSIPGVAEGELPLAGGAGETKIMTLPASGAKTAGQIAPADITVFTEPPQEGDAWLPSAFYVLGAGADGKYSVICAIPEWPSQIWLSKDTGDHHYPSAFPGVTLDQVLKALNPM